MSQQLNVFLRAEHVGRLWLDENRRFVFQYDGEWVVKNTSIPLSLNLPLQLEPFVEDSARPFFANLLPESELRQIIAKKLGLSEQNDFALLEAVGGECAGAVSLLPEGQQPAGVGSYKKLDDDQLNELIAELPRRPLLAGEEGIRLSLAGAQNKLPVYFDGQRISLPMGTAASSHILKPPIAHYPHTVENEAFCMQLAARLGLSVPNVTILHKATPLYLIKRYDRERNDQGELIRIHQEDFCQALGVPPDMKYEKEGGPGLRACFELLRDNSLQPLQDILSLFDWVLFNYLIGNADAHAKNISLILADEAPRLAPFYDLMSTAVYPDLTEKLAMNIGGENRPNWVIERKWRQFAEEVGVGFKLIRSKILDMSTSLPDTATMVARDFQQHHGTCEIIESILAVIGQRSRKITNILSANRA